jgi:membrane-associated phospholipid phosphatase
MKLLVSRILSDVFNPLVNAVVAFLVIIATDPNAHGASKPLAAIVAVLFAAALPLLALLVMKQRGLITNVNIDRREQRTRPFILGILCYAVGFFFLKLFHAPRLAQGLMFCYAVNTAVILAITRYWKISVHATGISGPLMALYYQLGSVVLPYFSLIPLVCASRVVMRKHTVGQVVAGTALGLTATAAQINLLFR